MIFILFDIWKKLLGGSSPCGNFSSTSKHKLHTSTRMYSQEKLGNISYFNKILSKIFVTNKFLYISEYGSNTEKLLLKVLPKSFIIRLRRGNKESERKK